MKEVKDPIVGNLFVIRKRPSNYGTILAVYTHPDSYWASGLMIKIEWIKNDTDFHSTEDFAHPGKLGLENFYLYLDLKDIPQNRLIVNLKYS